MIQNIIILAVIITTAIWLLVRSRKVDCQENKAPANQSSTVQTPIDSSPRKRKKPVYDTLRFQYRDGEGSVTERTVDITMGMRGDELRGHCHLRGEERSFKVGRILNGEVTRVDTGETFSVVEWRKTLKAQ